MSGLSIPYHELLGLCIALSDGSISDADFARLDAVLAGDAKARAFYLEFMRLSAMLEQRASSGQGSGVGGEGWGSSLSDSDAELWTLDEVEDLLAPPTDGGSLVDLTDELARRKREAKRAARERLRARAARLGGADAAPHGPFVIPKSVAWLGFAAALVLAAVLVTVYTRQPAADPSLATHPAPGTSAGSDQSVPAAVATLTYVDRAVWSGGQQPSMLRRRVGPGVLRLDSGVAHFMLDSGAVLMLRGPVEVDLTSPWEAWLSRGQVVARVPVRAHGYRVRGEGFVVTDLGTEFAVRVGEGGVQCRVVLGEVELATPVDGGSGVALENLGANRLVGIDRETGAVTDLDPGEADDIAWALPYASDLNRELVVNGGFEDGELGVAHRSDLVDVVAIPGWDDTAPGTVLGYEQAGTELDVGFPDPRTDPMPDGRGEGYYFVRHPGTMSQTVDLSAVAPLTDAGQARYVFSADLGGYITQDDRALVSVVFLGADGRALSRADLEPVDAAARGGRTGFLHRSFSAALPAGTRWARIEVTGVRHIGGFTDGFADNISLIIEVETSGDARGSALPLPPPSSAAWSQGGGRFDSTPFLAGPSCDVPPGILS